MGENEEKEKKKEVWTKNYEYFVGVFEIKAGDEEVIESTGHIISDVDVDSPARCDICNELVVGDYEIIDECDDGEKLYLSVISEWNGCEHFRCIDDGEYQFGIKLANATMHPQNQYEAELKNLGFKVVTEPLGENILTDATAEDIKEIADSIICHSINADAVLVGGLGSLTYYVIRRALYENITPYEVITERIRDDEGKFVFNFKGLREIKYL